MATILPPPPRLPGHGASKLEVKDAERPSQIRTHLHHDLNMPVSSFPPDEGDDSPRRTYNFAPTYRGLVYRAVGHDGGEKDGGEKGKGKKAGEEGQGDAVEEAEAGEGQMEGEKEVQYKLQTMKWGLIPSWTKRAPDFSASLKTINCRAESLMSTHGMWTSMKQRKRCVVLVEGFYEWLHRGREKIPHYVKRKDGGMLCLAGLWDCVRYEGGEVVYTYTIVTRASSKQLAFLHDRMPVILEPGGEEMWRWLDPKKGWGDDVARCLKGWDGELEVFEVDRGVGKVGNDSPDFVVPVGKGKGGIEGFFGGKKGVGKKAEVKDEVGKKEVVDEVGKKEEVKDEAVKKEEEQDRNHKIKHEPTTKKEEPNEGDIKMESIEADNLDSPAHRREPPKKEEADEKEKHKPEPPKQEAPSSPTKKEEDSKQGIKREHDDNLDLKTAEPVKKEARTSASPVKREGRGLRSSTRNDRGVVTPKKGKKGEKGEQKITGFFGKK
ncbi:hypothetical protein VE02_05716 [Pseudogymnoascus sp. 03VT05]|nr:hypothetical protein VE02_05716 [Pseudogymnoascus sp. 03VT05]